MATISEAQAREMAEYIYLSGFNKKAVLVLMSGPIRKHLENEGYTIAETARSEWMDPNYENSKWSQKFVRGMTYLNTPVNAGQLMTFRKMQPLIVQSGSKSKSPAGVKEKLFVGSVKTEVLDNIEKIAEGASFEEITIEDGESGEAPAVPDTPQVAITIPGAVPRLTNTRKLRKSTFPENGRLPMGDKPVIISIKSNQIILDNMAIPKVWQKKAPQWTQPALILIFEQGQTVRYTFDNTSDIYELMMNGEAVICEGGNVYMDEFKAEPTSVTGFEAKLSTGTFFVSKASGGIKEFFSPNLVMKEGYPFPPVIAPLVGFPVPDLTNTEVDGLEMSFSMSEYANDGPSRKNWFPSSRTLTEPVNAGTQANPTKWVGIYDHFENIAWTPDSLEMDAQYLQPIPFDTNKATKLDLSKQYIQVEMEVDAATDNYTGYDWKAPTSTSGTLIFPGDERNLIPISRDEDGNETELKNRKLTRGDQITDILFAGNQARIEVKGGEHFMIPDDSGDGTFYAYDNRAAELPDGKQQELKARIKSVQIVDYESGATPDDTWNNMKAARRYKNLATSILPAAVDGPGKTCSVCGMEDVVSPCDIENCPMPTETEVGVASLAYESREASGTYIVLLVPDEKDPSSTYEIRLTVRN